MKRMILLLLVIALIFLTGCGKHLDAGTVIEKTYTPAYKTYTPSVMIINKRTQIIPRWTTHSETYSITIEDGDVRDTWYVDKDTYDSVEIGQYIERTRDK